MKMVPVPPPTTSSPMMSSSHQQFEVTEDTPVDFLEGCMEILVVFPNEKSIPMSIQRRMPMLDLLIHVTAANKISPAAHLLQVTDEEGRMLAHKPSTPIGSLNAHKVYIVPKNRLTSDRSARVGNTKSSPSSSSPFEQSFRVQVRLPRNQLFVTRLTGRTQLADLLHTVCNEKALDPRRYELRHPVNLDERLRLNSCLDDYKLQEVVLVPLGGKNSQTGALSVNDLSTMSRKSVAINSSSNSNMPGSSKLTSKTSLRATSSEATLAGHEKKKRGLFGLLGFGRNKKGSSMGDSSISSDSAGDRSISPSRSEEPSPPTEPQPPVTPRPPSPVLFSKRLAEEAVAKRNSRLLMSQMSAETSPMTTTSANGQTLTRQPSTPNGTIVPSKPGAKKKRAPAPPPPSALLHTETTNGPPKAASDVSSYSTSSSSAASHGVSPLNSSIHHSETETARSPSLKRSNHREIVNTTENGSPRRPISNLLTSPHVSSSNLTLVSSTSNASLASAIKKRKAPVPPPALREQTELGENPAADEKRTTIINGSHDESDRASSVSDQLSSVSDLSSPQKSTTPEVEPIVERTHVSPVVAPIPAVRTSIPVVSPTATTTTTHVDRLVDGRQNRRHHSMEEVSSSDEDVVVSDGQNLDMFANRDEVDQVTAAQRLIAKQLELQARQKMEKEELRRIREEQRQAKEAERRKMGEKLANEKRQLETIEQDQPGVTSWNMAGESERNQSDHSQQIHLDVFATESESSSSSPTPGLEHVHHDENLQAVSKQLRVPSRTSSASEFFSLSEGEDDEDIDRPSVSSPLRSDPIEDPDVAFAAMCVALARRREDEPSLPDAVDILKSLEDSQTEETIESDPNQDALMWRRSSSEPGWISERLRPISQPTTPSRRSSSFDGGSRCKSSDIPADLPIFPPLSNSFFSAVLSSRGEYEDIPLLLISDDADGQPSRHSHPGLLTDTPINGSSLKRQNTADRQSDVTSEDDYEVVRYQKDESNVPVHLPVEGVHKIMQPETYNRAVEEEEMVVPEPIYTMVIKSPRLMRAVDQPLDKDQTGGPTSGEVIAELDKVIRQASSAEDEEEEEEGQPDMERDAGDGQTESPVMWEYKLPAPPTPFQDSNDSHLDKLEFASDSNLSRRSSMSADSFQNSGDQVELQTDSLDYREPVIEVFTKQEPTAVVMELHRGIELLDETPTEEQIGHLPEVKAVEVTEKVPQEDKIVILGTSDPQAQQYGIESTTDEPISLPEISSSISLPSLPPIPNTLPPSDSEDDSIQSTDMRFSIATYNRRIIKDSSYEEKLRSGSPDGLPSNLTASIDEPEKEVIQPLHPVAVETKGPEITADPVTANVSGSSDVPASIQPSLPMINADFIQQFQNALHSIADPKARALQEEFLRLQQQLLTLQMQTSLQQNSSPVPAATEESLSPAASPVSQVESVKEVSNEANIQSELVTNPLEAPESINVECKEIEIIPSVCQLPSETQLINEPVSPSTQLRLEPEQQPEEDIVASEAPIYRYRGPPQVKLDTWKPGRPRSEVIDFSRSSSFNVPMAPVEKKNSLPAPVISSQVVTQMDGSPVVPSVPEKVEAPVQVSPVSQEKQVIPVVANPDAETIEIRERVDKIESNNASNSRSASPKPIAPRKSSYLTARPFEARPVSMPIKKPSFTPMVIQPVPFVSRKIRAPEVRGFASLPPVDSDTPPAKMAGPTGVVPFSSVNKNRTIASVSKENPTIAIRNKLIESARRPSAELNGSPFKSDDLNQIMEPEETKGNNVIVIGSKRNSLTRPLSMPTSSSLLLAAGAGGVVNKTPTVNSPEIPSPSLLPSAAQQSFVSGADVASTTGRRSLSSKFVRKTDPREELLNSIRSFANGGSLKKTGANLDK